jgi:hypothetical protein
MDDLPEEYYRQLRGLNKSFLGHLTAQAAKDEFTDFTVPLEKYRHYRADILKKYGGKAAETPAPAAPAPAPLPAFKLPPLAFGAGPTTAAPAAPATSAASAAPTASAAPQFKLAPLVPAAGGGVLQGMTLSNLPPLTFGGASAGAAPGATAAAAADDEDDGDDDGPVPAEEPTKPEQFKKGAGEEDEDTLFELPSVKLFERQADNKWEKLGVGLLRVSENRATHKRRLLSRSEGVGQVLLNTAMFAGMRATLAPAAAGGKATSVTLLCALPGKALAPILVRTATEAEATQLIAAIDKYKPAAA